MEGYAVYVHNVDKYYNSKQILMNFNMRVKKGSIYGLLGPSGCGKTTLLSCIVGRRKIDSGSVWVLGGVPGHKSSGVPGPRVGYMPQDVALVTEFSVKGAIYYFGHIFKMSRQKIQERYKLLRHLLDLPPGDRVIKNCSGGQQRRVSIACAMVHEPELLILDEPTVGLDPVLRNSIWNHLIELAHSNNTAIIITTHYIEEAKQADTIGLMRGGRLLIEESPMDLLSSFRTDSLEEVFLNLSKQHENGTLQDQFAEEDYIIQNGDYKSTEALVETKRALDKRPKMHGERFTISRHHLAALMSKNYLQYFKNTTSLMASLVFPVLNLLIFFIAIGRDVNVDLAIVNNEYHFDICENYNRGSTAIPNNFVDCDFRQLSCRFLDDIQDPTINKLYYNDLDLALNDVRHGKVVGVMYFSNNFTNSYQKRVEEGSAVDNETLNTSEIKVWLDMSGQQVGLQLKFKLLNKYLDFQKNLTSDCNLSIKLTDMPINIMYEYGNDKEPFIDFMVPGVLLQIMYFVTTTMTSAIIIQDRLDGVWDRSIVAGVTAVEIVLTHFMTQFIVVSIQVAEVIIITFGFYRMEYFGDLSLITFMVFLQGMGGMACGFMISVVSETHNMANILATGMFFPIFVLCGMLWPLQGQPIGLQYISKSLPFTAAIESLRHIMRKGWNLKYIEVLNGIGISILWFLIFSLLSILLIRRKR